MAVFGRARLELADRTGGAAADRGGAARGMEARIGGAPRPADAAASGAPPELVRE